MSTKETYRITTRTTGYSNIRFRLGVETSDGENQDVHLFVGEGIFLDRRIKRAKAKINQIMRIAGYVQEGQ